LVLIGNSQGSTSVAYAGKTLGKKVDGVILTASVFDWAPPAWRLLYDSNLSDFDFSKIASPLLIVHHADDRCVATTYSSAAKLAGKHPFITVRGGEAVQDNGCGPLGPHGFLGREEPVVTEIKNWIHGRPYQAEIH
jgi:predicted alpha/beta hydrolase family esterase